MSRPSHSKPARSSATGSTEFWHAPKFDELIEHLKTRYAYTAFRGLDWDAISSTYRPRIVAAEAQNDPGAYFIALKEMAMSLKDTHTVATAGYSNQTINKAVLDTELAAFGAEIGASALIVSDPDEGISSGDLILVDQVSPGTPAADLGWTAGTRIIEIQGKSASDYLAALPLASATGVEELQPYLRAPRFFRFPMGADVTVKFQNPGEGPRTETVSAGDYPAPLPSNVQSYSGLPIDIKQVGGVAIVSWSDFVNHMLSKVSVLEEAF